MIILWPLMGGCHGATASRYKNLVPEKHAKGLHHLNQMILFFCLEYIACMDTINSNTHAEDVYIIFA